MSSFKRQHPFMIVHNTLRVLKGLMLPLAVVVFSSLKGDREAGNMQLLIYTILVAIYCFGSFLTGILRWYFFKYQIQADGTMMIRSGVIFKNERTIRPESVQTTQLRATLLHRISGLTGLSIETAGGRSEPEISFAALENEEALRIKNVLAGEPRKLELVVPTEAECEIIVPDGGEDDNPTRVLAGSDLLIAGATTGVLGIVFSMLVGLVLQFQDYIPAESLKTAELVLQGQGYIVVALWSMVLLGVAWLLAAIYMSCQYASFKITRTGNRLQITRGLLERRTVNLETNRIQAVCVHENLLRQPLGFASITARVILSGSRGESGEVMLFPLVRVNEIQSFLDAMVPGYTYQVPAAKPPSRALFRYVRRPCLGLLVVSVFAMYWKVEAPLFALAALPFAGALGFLRFQDAGYGIKGSELVLRFRNISRVTALLKRRKIEVVESLSNPFQSFRNLETLSLTVLCSPQKVQYQLTDFDREVAARLRKWFRRTRDSFQGDDYLALSTSSESMFVADKSIRAYIDKEAAEPKSPPAGKFIYTRRMKIPVSYLVKNSRTSESIPHAKQRILS